MSKEDEKKLREPLNREEQRSGRDLRGPIAIMGKKSDQTGIGGKKSKKAGGSASLPGTGPQDKRLPTARDPKRPAHLIQEKKTSWP